MVYQILDHGQALVLKRWRFWTQPMMQTMRRPSSIAGGVCLRLFPTMSDDHPQQRAGRCDAAGSCVRDFKS